MGNKQDIQYVVGKEKRLKDLISESELSPLLNSALKAGICNITLKDDTGNIIVEAKQEGFTSGLSCQYTLTVEGEPAGQLLITSDAEELKPLADLIYEALRSIINSNLKRVLTTEVHSSVVTQSYEELLETNRKLKESETRYRDLAENLDRKVQERTEELKKAYTRLIQQEKMASIGQLAAGLAHEINNPMGFIMSNLSTLQRYIERLREFINTQAEAIRKTSLTELISSIEEKRKVLKIDYLLQDSIELIRDSLEGSERVKKIVSDLKGFSHIDDAKISIIDINKEIDRTLNVLIHEIPDDAEIVKEYNDLPGFRCNPASICQAFLNIILNALQARQQGLKLKISTYYKDGMIHVIFSDNGPGIPEDIRERIFEPFFTTKEIGKGTGLGLTVVYDVITSYGGGIDIESKTGEGTTVKLTLPVKGDGDV